jgi:hypothetical protein
MSDVHNVVLDVVETGVLARPQSKGCNASTVLRDGNGDSNSKANRARLEGASRQLDEASMPLVSIMTMSKGQYVNPPTTVSYMQ